MTDLQQCKPITVHLPNGSTTIVTTIGSVKIKPNLTLRGVLYIPTFTYNLISVSKLTNSTHSTITFTQNKCIFQGHDGSKTIGSLHGGLYTLASTSTSTPLTTAFTHLSSNNLWHARLGHASSQILNKIKSISPLFQCNSDFTCTVCPLSKQHKLPFPISNSHATSPFSLVHLDVWGPYKHPTLTKCTYFLTIVDDFSRATWTYFLPSKHHVCSTMQLFHSYVNTQFQTQIKTIRSDNGTEFLNESFNTFTQSHGIIHQTSCPYTPQQNGRVERKHRHLLEVARSLYFQAKFPIHLWGHCILTSTYLINRLPSKILNYKSPFEVLYQKPPQLDHLRVIGCQAHVYTHTTDKFGSKSTPTVLVGYPQNQKGYILYDPHTQKTITSRHVIFDESIFPYHKTQHQTPSDPFTSPLQYSTVQPQFTTHIHSPSPSNSFTPSQ